MIAFAVVLVITAITAPWSNYPTNDDWQYARAAKLLDSTGQIIIDTPIAPSLVGALAFTWPFVKVFGFSHTLLRVLTLSMAALVFFSLDALLRIAEVRRAVRVQALLLIAVNPLALNLTLSFMTEYYGYAPALLGAVIWLRHRRFAETNASPPLSFRAAIGVGVLVGSTFWTRQYCVLVYPALVAALLVCLASAREWGRLKQAIVPLAAGCAAFALPIALYFVWASGRLKPEFAVPLHGALRFSLVNYLLMLGVYYIYIGAFLLPLFVTWPLAKRFPPRGRLFRRKLATCALALGFGLCAFVMIRLHAQDYWDSWGMHRTFPFLSNVIHNSGLGPVTLSDVYFHGGDVYPTISRSTWSFIGRAFVASTALWGLPLLAAKRLGKASRPRREVTLFAAGFSALSLIAVVQAYGNTGFDRYMLPVLFGCTVCVACLLTLEKEAVPAPGAQGRRRVAWTSVAFAVALLPVGAFSVAGVHDYFRWNDVRWRLVDHALRLGVPSTSIDGGYEVNGWLSYDAVSAHAPDKSGCIGACTCEAGELLWTCHDDSYRIGMNVRNGYVELLREEPDFWIGQDRPLILSRRPDPPPRRR